MPRIAVIDLSHHNTVPASLQPARDAGVVGVIHKASESSDPRYADEKYGARRALAAQAGLLWGAYHFLRPGSVAAQVEVFLKCAAPDEHTLMACDYEDAAVTVAQLVEFMTTLETKLGRPPVLYAGNVLKEKLGATANPDLSKYRLWLAQYGSKPVCPAGWSVPWLWQYSDGKNGPAPHAVPGVNPPVDCDDFAGTDDELRAQWSGAPVAEPAPAPAPQPEQPAPAAESVVSIAIKAPPGVRVEVTQS